MIIGFSQIATNGFSVGSQVNSAQHATGEESVTGFAPVLSLLGALPVLRDQAVTDQEVDAAPETVEPDHSLHETLGHEVFGTDQQPQSVHAIHNDQPVRVPNTIKDTATGSEPAPSARNAELKQASASVTGRSMEPALAMSAHADVRSDLHSSSSAKNPADADLFRLIKDLPAATKNTNALPPTPVGQSTDAVPQALGTSRNAPAQMPEWSPVKASPEQAHWGRELMAALSERVEMQLNQHVKQARIRLDPPELGSLQLTVRLENDRLSIQLHASQQQTRDALAQQADRLRADLAGQHGDRVDVWVGQEQRQQHSPQQHTWQGIEFGLADAEEESASVTRWQSWVNALV